MKKNTTKISMMDKNYQATGTNHIVLGEIKETIGLFNSLKIIDFYIMKVADEESF